MLISELLPLFQYNLEYFIFSFSVNIVRLPNEKRPRPLFNFGWKLIVCGGIIGIILDYCFYKSKYFFVFVCRYVSNVYFAQNGFWIYKGSIGFKSFNKNDSLNRTFISNYFIIKRINLRSSN